MNAPDQAILDEAPQADSPFVTVMKTWSAWMRLKDQEHSTGGGAADQDTKEFMAIGEAVSVMVCDLTTHERWAVRRAFGVCDVWIYPQISLPDTLARAEDILMPKLKKNVATRRYFN